ncbi:hypothetical protein C8J36_1062 [Rhizobium sp. PP-F2F-G48]|nr:hypothetical protein C8J36_1062 [Rhizobium sp. PP-F2F-G48]
MGTLIADRLARALLKNVSRKQKYHIDQIIPFYLLQSDGKKAVEHIYPLPSTISSLDYAEDAAFWTAKGVNKRSEKFQSLQTVHLSE